MGRGLLEVKVKQPALEVLTVAICSIQDVEDILPIRLLGTEKGKGTI
jgi:hypothetical protein